MSKIEPRFGPVTAAATDPMIIASHVPRAPLNAFIDVLWFHEGVDSDHSLERVLPDGSVELIVNLREESRHVFDHTTYQPRQAYRGSWLAGPHSESIIIDTAPDASMIGAHFKPSGASAFFRLPLSDLRNSVFELECFWNGGAQTLREQLLAAPKPAAKFRVFEDALLARWRGDSVRHRAVLYALQRFADFPELTTIAHVTAEIGLSPRRFIEVFSQQVGMTPKLFCRVRRLKFALEEMQKTRAIVWADLAASCGYYDQAHFIHDFKEFCGVRPGDYAEEQPEDPRFIPIRG